MTLCAMLAGPLRLKRKANGAVIGVMIMALHTARLMSRRMAGVLLLSFGSPNMKLTMAV
jgi:hypothetical protein